MARPKSFVRSEVLVKAMNCFWNKGFHGTSMQDLVSVTGLNRGSLYHEFKDKEDLYLQALQYYREEHFLPAIRRLHDDSHWEQHLIDLLSSATTCASDSNPLGCFIANCLADQIGSNPAINKVMSETLYLIELHLNTLLSTHRGGDHKGLANLILSILLGRKLLQRHPEFASMPPLADLLVPLLKK